MGNALAPTSATLFDAIAGGDADAAVGALQAHPNLSRKRLGTKRRNLYHICAANGQVAVLRSLCEHVWRTVPDEGGVVRDGPPSSRKQHPAIRQAINMRDQKGLTPLSLACKHGHARVVEYLILQGADPWVKDRLQGKAPLHHAARANNPECIEAILSSLYVEQIGNFNTTACKLVDYPSNAGYTPLHYAAASHSAEAAVALLSHGADPNAKTWDVGFDYIQLDRGSTPLHSAARLGNLDVAMLLLKYWYDNLRCLDVTDPRVVENFLRIKPYQMAGVKLNKALLRVLDPATSIREISDPFGQTSKAIIVPPSKAAPLKQAQHSGRNLSYHRQDSESSKLSCGSGGGDDAGLASVVGASQSRRTATNEGETQRPGAPPGSWPAMAPATQLQVPAGWEDLLAVKSAGVPTHDKGHGSTPDFVSLYRCSDLDNDPSVRPPVTATPVAASPFSTSQEGQLRKHSSVKRTSNCLLPPAATSLGRTRSGAVFPLPSANTAQQLQRTGSLQPQPTASHYNVVPSQSRRRGDNQHSDNGAIAPPYAQQEPSCLLPSTPGDVYRRHASTGHRARPAHNGSTGVGEQPDTFNCELPAPATPPVMPATTQSSRSLSARDGSVYAGTADGPGYGGGGSGSSMKRSGSDVLKVGTSSQDLDKSTSGRSLVKTLSRKLMSAASGTASSSNDTSQRPATVISAWADRSPFPADPSNRSAKGCPELPRNQYAR